MKPKTINILYWVFTVLFAGLMIFSSVGGIGPNEQTIEIFHKFLGYPIYFIQFISWAKIIGVIALLLPINRTIKEWAYAGLFFDLVGAAWSAIWQRTDLKKTTLADYERYQPDGSIDIHIGLTPTPGTP